MNETAELPPQGEAQEGSGDAERCPACGHTDKALIDTWLKQVYAAYLRKVWRQRPACEARVNQDATGWGGSLCTCDDPWHVAGT